MTTRIRGLLEAEQGTRILAGKPYHWTRENRVDLRTATRRDVLFLTPGIDPAEPGTCEAMLKFGPRFYRCAIDSIVINGQAWHPGDHLAENGLYWPNPEGEADLNEQVSEMIATATVTDTGESA